MNDYTPTTTQAALRFGFYTGLASMVFYLILLTSGLYPFYQVVGNVILIIGIYLGINAFKNWSGGNMTYMQGLGLGLLLSTITGIMVGLLWLGYLNVNPWPMQRDMELTKAYYEERQEAGEINAEDAQKKINQARLTLRPGMYFFNYTVSYFLIGLLFSLIISAYVRNNL